MTSPQTDKPLDKLNREELNERARSAGVEDPEQYDTKADVIAAIEAANATSLDPAPPATPAAVVDGPVASADAAAPVAAASNTEVTGRIETYEAVRPDGAVVRVTRNIDTDEQVVTRADATDLGVPMLPGDPKEPVGPEDALGAGPTRGDYRGRIGEASYQPHTVVPVTDPQPGGPRTVAVPQRPFAEEIGEVPGQKGGVDGVR